MNLRVNQHEIKDKLPEVTIEDRFDTLISDYISTMIKECDNCDDCDISDVNNCCIFTTCGDDLDTEEIPAITKMFVNFLKKAGVYES